jgi:hypothetical protein
MALITYTASVTRAPVGVHTCADGATPRRDETAACREFAGCRCTFRWSTSGALVARAARWPRRRISTEGDERQTYEQSWLKSLLKSSCVRSRRTNRVASAGVLAAGLTCQYTLHDQVRPGVKCHSRGPEPLSLSCRDMVPDVLGETNAATMRPSRLRGTARCFLDTSRACRSPETPRSPGRERVR